MYQPNNQLSVHTKALSIQNSSALVPVDLNETSLDTNDDIQNGGFAQAETIIQHSQKLQGDLHMLGMKIKQHEDSLNLHKDQKDKVEDSILNLQVSIGKLHPSSTPKIDDGDSCPSGNEEEIIEQILQHEKSAAGILCQLKTHHGTQASHLTLIKDVVGVVATLGKVDNDNLSRLFSEYLGVETMLAIVCKTYEGVRALETYDNEGSIIKASGLHGLGASIGRPLGGRFLVICLESLRPYAGKFVVDDPQKKLDIISPRLPNGECPDGFLGFAVNMINIDGSNLFCVTPSGYGLRETLFYNLFSRLQIYKTRAEMMQALPCINDGALSLDGGMIRSSGVFFLGNREDVDVRFPRPGKSVPDNYIETESQLKDMKRKKEKILEDMKRERALLDTAKFEFNKKKNEFLKFLAESSSYATQLPLCRISYLLKMATSKVDWKPRLGMEFDSVEAAWQFWVDYGEKTGFGVRKQYYNKNKRNGSITSCRFVCCKEGHRREDKRDTQTIKHRPETRTDCKARIGLLASNGKFKIHEFVEVHNHPLLLAETTHMLASQHKISEVQVQEIELTKDSELQQGASFQLMSIHVGGRANLGFTLLDAKNYLEFKRQRRMVYEEVGCLLQYFQRQLLENSSFYHAYQMDMDQQITNVFWADERMVIDYGYFGDVVSLDTTYCTNSAYRPLALFSGFNHHRGAIIFGAALLYEETMDSFKWLFEIFLEAHKQKRPQTIFTNQDQAIDKALIEVMPETCHGLCSWNLMQNGIKYLGNLMNDESHFLNDFKKCMYEYMDEVQFEVAWSKLLSEYDVYENTWLKSMYTIKEKWAACHMKKAFTLGMRSMQHTESLNSDFKACMKHDVDIIQFFEHFERVMEEKRHNELKSDFEARHKLPMLKCENSPMLKQLAQIYTFTPFDLFQKEFDFSSAACIKLRNEAQPVFEYVVTIVGLEGEWKVSFDPFDRSITCSCRKFETFGILCCHALKVFDVMDIKLVPEQYILKRWTRDGRNGIIHDVREKEVEDVKLASMRQYRQLCSKMIRLAYEASNCKEAYLLVDKAIDGLYKQVMEVCLKKRSTDNHNGDTTTLISEGVAQAKGIENRIVSKEKETPKELGLT